MTPTNASGKLHLSRARNAVSAAIAFIQRHTDGEGRVHPDYMEVVEGLRQLDSALTTVENICSACTNPAGSVILAQLGVRHGQATQQTT